jgi:RsiW-degrading membrane proteinase PrsW (M82 family)
MDSGGGTPSAIIGKVPKLGRPHNVRTEISCVVQASKRMRTIIARLIVAAFLLIPATPEILELANMLPSDLIPGATVAAAVAPALLLLWLVVIADSRPEPQRVVLLCIGLGAISVLPAYAIEAWLDAHIPITPHSWSTAYEAALLSAGLPEEALKVSIITVVAWRVRDFDEPMDGVVYGTAVGLGFAAVENLLYVAGAADWANVAILRAILSVPGHGANGAIAGAYIARARFGGALGGSKGGHWRRRRLLWSAWLVPIVLHSLYDGSLFRIAASNSNPIEILAMALIGAAAWLGGIVFAIVLTRRIGRHQKAWLRTKRLPPAQWRGVWGESLFGLGLSAVAVALIIAGNTLTRIAGLILMAISLGITRKCAKYLNEVAVNRHRPAIDSLA